MRREEDERARRTLGRPPDRHEWLGLPEQAGATGDYVLGRTYPELAQIVREVCAVASRCCQPVAAVVPVTIAGSRGPIRAVLS